MFKRQPICLPSPAKRLASQPATPPSTIQASIPIALSRISRCLLQLSPSNYLKVAVAISRRRGEVYRFLKSVHQGREEGRPDREDHRSRQYEEHERFLILPASVILT